MAPTSQDDDGIISAINVTPLVDITLVLLIVFMVTAKIIVSRWGFRLQDILTSVHLWYWEEDFAIPPQMGRYLEARIPNTIAHFLPGGGHLSLFDHWGEIIEPLVSD